ncbi:arrestin domain-containing protein 17 [Drosophila tropicalis]|uniref:arrestin domain-containing protein 17 n=1 Tax=Drosophila tropicalis TaxID=46794 RepID=UPI0035AC2577
MSSKVTFAFDNNPQGVYYAGQVISGTAELITDRPKTIRSIYITINGFGETRWQENVEKSSEDGSKQVKSLATHTSTEIYYTNDQYVYGQSGGTQLELPKGKFVFPFHTTIPPNAPTSFNGRHGQIKHEVTLTIDRSVRYNNIFKQCFTVILPTDLNAKREHVQPLKRIEEKSFWWGSIFGANKPMVMDVSTSFSAYAPGQKIHFHIALDNQSDVQCQDVKVRLFKNVTYRAKSGSTASGEKPEIKVNETESRIADKHCGEVLKHNKATFNEYLVVPPTTPTTLEPNGNQPIKVSYTLRFIAKTFRLHGGGDLVVDFPLVIGTVPLLASAGDLGPGQTNSNNSGFVGAPVFQEDVSSEQFESNTYKPRYPVYNFNGNGQSTAGNSNGTTAPTPSLYPKAEDKPPVQHTANPVSPAPAPAPAIHKSPPYPTAGPNPGNNFEVLGFSIPPDYKPTPSAPADSSIGWK